MPVGRLEALLHHEVGTHVVTYVNGAHQPLHVLACGLAGHDETQEGLAVLAEHLVGGLTPTRLRQLAGRVVAVARDGGAARRSRTSTRASSTRGIPDHQAFSITVRVFRAGGLTKDAVYLRGLRELVDHLAAGADLDVLWLGKMPLSAAPLVADLHARGELHDALLRPRYLDDPAAQGSARAPREVALAGRADGSRRMRIGFVVNGVSTEQPEYTTTRLALAATRRGHDTWLMGVDDFSHRARRLRGRPRPHRQGPQAQGPRRPT